MIQSRTLPILMLLALAGCTQTPTAAPSPAPPTPGTTGSATPTAPAPAEPKPVTRADIPANVKTLGYQYFGLEKDMSPTFEFRGAPSGIQQGAVETKLSKIEGGNAYFTQTYTGSLAYLGATEVVARPDGVFSTKVGEEPVDPPQKELGADPKVGDSWSNTSKVNVSGSELSSSTMKIEGAKKVTVKMGTFDSLVVTSVVEGTRGGKPIKVSMTAFYVKDYGPVKIQMVAPGPDGKPATTTLEAIKKP